MIQPHILFEDDYLLAINKPSGMVVNRGFATEDETLQDWIDTNFNFPLAHDFEMRNGLVHRLDKETSGVLLIAKTPEVFENLQKQFKERGVEKGYVALVHGRVEPTEGTINAPVGRLPWKRTRFGVLKDGREAKTLYIVKSLINQLASQISTTYNLQPTTYNLQPTTSLSLLELYPKTGRTHQIRVHLKHIGHPVVGDILYAGRKTARRDREWCPRLFLHAKSLTFTHPVTEKHITIEAPLPKELEDVLLL
ncbi:MAG: RluA family pseudouridine synthase [Candidatus Blackburnbacteria bacterium]|nr:RluA family pseudouridine synthase [Candidatus Blackburnbacteria bacterium]